MLLVSAEGDGMGGSSVQQVAEMRERFCDVIRNLMSFISSVVYYRNMRLRVVARNDNVFFVLFYSKDSLFRHNFNDGIVCLV